ncbi:MAG: DUF2085 domain-containing protein [Chloroflexi bacterium]|nr:DUF2085 domain-containing protein [Chloroflexota bacterium]
MNQPPHYSSPPSTSPAVRLIVLMVDRLVFFIARHWLALVTGMLGLYVGVPFLAPILMHYGYVTQAEWVYNLFSLNCHQLAHRSYFLFGAQPVYPLDDLRALVPGGADENAISFFWRDFRGNAELGYKVAVCERDLAIYGAMIWGGLMFALFRRQLRPLDWRLWVLFAVAPMGLDGGSQLIGLRQSDYMLRTITGALFGMGSVWLAYPHVEIAMRDLRSQAQEQWARARRVNL